MQAGIDRLQRGDLRRGKTLARLTGFANEARWVEMALPGIIENAVLAMAGFKRRVGYDREFLGEIQLSGVAVRA